MFLFLAWGDRSRKILLRFTSECTAYAVFQEFYGFLCSSQIPLKSVLVYVWDNDLVSFLFFYMWLSSFPITIYWLRGWSFSTDCSFCSFVINCLYVCGFISGIKKMQNIYKMRCYSARKHEMLLFATAQVDLEGIVLREISQRERQRPWDFTHVWTRKKPINKHMKKQNRWTNQTKKEHIGRRRRKGGKE